MKLYITYGMGSDRAGKYSVVEAPTRREAREIAQRETDGKFAFDYTEEQFLPQIEKYGLKEIPIGPQRM